MSAFDSDRHQQRSTSRIRASSHALVPGQRFHLAIQLDILPAYWVPWASSSTWGDAPFLHVNAPDEFSVSDPLMPGPERILVHGTPWLGYRESAAWFVEVVAPLDLDPEQRYRFEVFTTWRTCGRKDCQLQDARAVVWIGMDELAPEPAFEGDLQVHFEAVPRPVVDGWNGSQHWEESPEGKVLVLSVPTGRWMDYLPVEGSDAPASLERRGRFLRVSYPEDSPDARAVASLVVDGQVRFASITGSPQ